MDACLSQVYLIASECNKFDKCWKPALQFIYSEQLFITPSAHHVIETEGEEGLV